MEGHHRPALHCSVTWLFNLTLSWGVSMPSHVSIPLACLLLSLDRARSYGRCNNPTGFLTPLQACDQPRRSISLIHYGLIYGRQYFMFLIWQFCCHKKKNIAKHNEYWFNVWWLRMNGPFEPVHPVSQRPPLTEARRVFITPVLGRSLGWLVGWWSLDTSSQRCSSHRGQRWTT